MSDENTSNCSHKYPIQADDRCSKCKMIQCVQCKQFNQLRIRETKLCGTCSNKFNQPKAIEGDFIASTVCPHCNTKFKFVGLWNK